MRADQSRLDATHFRVAGRIRLSQDLVSHREVSPLLTSEVRSHQPPIGATEGGDVVGEIHADVSSRSGT